MPRRYSPKRERDFRGDERWLRGRLAAHILDFEDDGYAHWCEGNFETYERERKERMGETADEPKRFRYKKLA